MVKSRCSYLCNLKFVLIVLVVLGHCLEQADAQESVLYRIIYLFHMPLFAFVTGLHFKSVKSCLKQARAAALLYLSIQSVIVIVRGFVGLLCGTARVSLAGEMVMEMGTPFWHLWYLFSMCIWSLLAAFFCLCKANCIHRDAFSSALFENGHRLCKKETRAVKQSIAHVIAVLAAVLCALLCGVLPFGRFLSLFRTVCFFPYVLLGILCPVKLQEGIKLKTRCKMAVIGVIGTALTWTVLRSVPCGFFYRADRYDMFSVSPWEGCLLRGISFIAALCLGILVLALVPSIRLPVTKIGGDTLPVYLLHIAFVPVAALIDTGGIFLYGGLIVFSVWVVLVIWELGRWSRPVYTVLF